MNQIAGKKTVLRLTNRNVLEKHTETSHISARFIDVGYGTDGKPTAPPRTTAVLDDAQCVSRVSIDRDLQRKHLYHPGRIATQTE